MPAPNPLNRLVGARETAVRLLYNADGILRAWPDRATPYRNALLELVTAVDGVLTIDRYDVNPDHPDEGTDLHITLGATR